MLKDELETAKEAAQRAPSKTMKHLVERLRNQLALKEKQQKVECILFGLDSSIFDTIRYDTIRIHSTVRYDTVRYDVI